MLLSCFNNQSLALPRVDEVEIDALLGYPTQPLGGAHNLGNIFTKDITADVTDNWLVVKSIDPGLHVIYADYACDDELVCRVNSSNWLKFHFRVAGKNTIVFDGFGEYYVDSPRCLIMTQPIGVHKADFLGSAGHNRWLTLLLSKEYMLQKLGIDPEELPRPLRTFLTADTPDLYCQALPLNVTASKIIADLIENDDIDPIRNLYIESKALELICLVLREVSSHPARYGRIGINQKLEEKLETAKSILLSSLVSPPTLESLARQVGLNRSKLASEFRNYFGCTVYDVLTSERLLQAKKLLQETNFSIEKIAEDVGYIHPRNFSQAFRRHFGVTPRVARRRLKQL